MGLSVYGYSELSLISCISDRINAQTNIKDVYIEDNWKEFAPELENCSSYAYKDSLRYNIGPYSSYRVWRNDLAKLVEYKPISSAVSNAPYLDGARKESAGPFLKLLQFSDCSSYIGNEFSTSLFQDFIKYDDKAKAFAIISKSHNFYEIYSYLKKVFELASNGGAVEFS